MRLYTCCLTGLVVVMVIVIVIVLIVVYLWPDRLGKEGCIVVFEDHLKEIMG